MSRAAILPTMGFVELGVDICEISRIQEAVAKHPLFAPRHFTPEEITRCERTQKVKYFRELTECFTGKEAVAKAIGGIPHSFMDISITKDAEGRPHVDLRGRARLHADEMGINHISLSFAYLKNEVIAVCIAHS